MFEAQPGKLGRLAWEITVSGAVNVLGITLLGFAEPKAIIA